MSLLKNVQENIKNALKSGDKIILQVNRNILSEVKNLVISENLNRDLSEINDNHVLKIIKNLIKQKNETLEFSKQNNSSDLINLTNTEITYLNKFIPQMYEINELKDIISNKISSLGVNEKNIGHIMKILKKDNDPKIDYKLASNIIKNILDGE